MEVIYSYCKANKLKVIDLTYKDDKKALHFLQKCIGDVEIVYVIDLSKASAFIKKILVEGENLPNDIIYVLWNGLSTWSRPNDITSLFMDRIIDKDNKDGLIACSICYEDDVNVRKIMCPFCSIPTCVECLSKQHDNNDHTCAFCRKQLPLRHFAEAHYHHQEALRKNKDMSPEVCDALLGDALLEANKIRETMTPKQVLQAKLAVMKNKRTRG